MADAIVVTGGPKDIADGDVNISQKLSSVLLNEFNYLPWSRAITIALGGRSRLGFINGTSKSPESSSPEYAAWLSKDQQVMSWILNSMEHDLAAIFSYSESSLDLWNAVRDMYGNQNNSARIFQIHREIASLQQNGKPFVNLLGSLKSLWSELEIYRPPTTDTAILQKRTEEDRIFQLLASLNPDFEDLRSHILMNTDLPSFKNICATIQREEVRRKVMPRSVNTSPSDARAYITRSSSEEKSYKGKRPDLKCEHCHIPGHSINRCWTLHPELKPKFSKDQKGGGYQKRIHDYKAHMATHSLESFSSNPVALLNDFANYLQNRYGQEAVQGRSINQEKDQPAALLSQFAGFLADANSDTNEGIQIAFLTAFEINSLHDVWVIDSGATDHMSNKLTHVYDFHPFSTPSLVSVANGKGTPVQGKGKIKLVSDTIESDVLYVPSFPFQLLSVHKLTSSLNCEVLFTPHKVIFQDLVTKATIGEGFHLHGLYYFSPNSQVTKGFQAISFPIAEQDLWHRRLAHPSNNVLSKINRVLPKGTVDCDICHFSKSSRLPFNPSLSRTTQPFEIVHSDVWGPFSSSLDGFNYFVTFIDDFSRVTWVYLLKSKSEVFESFKDFHMLVTTQFSAHIKILRSDNGTEYMSHTMTNYLISHGILHQTSCVGTPQQNGLAERKNRDLLEKTRAIMLQMNVPKCFWSHGILTATYLVNRLPSRVLDFKCPLEVLQDKAPDLSHLKIFGCTCFVHVPTGHRDKLDPRAVKCIFLGYSQTQKGYKCFDFPSKKLYVTRDVRFAEQIPYFVASSQGEKLSELFPLLSELFPLPNINYGHQSTQDLQPTQDLHPSHATSEHCVDHLDISSDLSKEAIIESPEQDCSHTQDEPIASRRNPPRVRHPPTKLADYVAHTVRYPVTNFMSYQRLSPMHTAFLTAISNDLEPKNFHEAKSQAVWQKAMHEELTALAKNKTWTIVPLPPGKHAVGSRWVFKVKFNSDGSLDKHKARLVAQGFTQKFGVDYKETFAPVAKMTTVRVLLSVAINNGWSLFQMDVKNAFLHGDLEEEVFMKLPPGHPQSDNSNLVCQLHKSIYGLKQSPRAWHAKLSTALEALSFRRSSADSSLYVRLGSVDKLVVLIYVDDLIITGNNNDSIAQLKMQLQQKFPIKDLGSLKYFLGIEMATSSKGLFLNQRKYILDLLQDAEMLHTKPAATPLDSKLRLASTEKALDSPSYYQKLVGKLIYLTITRPDITFAVSLVSQHMHAPTIQHLGMIKRILRYLKGTIGRGIVMTHNGHTNIMGYTDSDWAGNALDRRSTTGYCMFVGGNLVSWKSKKQHVVARSSAEAEYRAMASAACELVWLNSLLIDLGCPSSIPMNLFCDNQAAMHIASNPVFHERTKHIEVDCHYIRQQVQSKLINTQYVRSNDQLADVFTKVLTTTQFHRLLSKLGSINPLDPA